MEYDVQELKLKIKLVILTFLNVFLSRQKRKHEKKRHERKANMIKKETENKFMRENFLRRFGFVDVWKRVQKKILEYKSSTP